MKFIYPCLGAYDMGFVRISGPGLANCMFVAARAYQYSKEMGASMVSPSWFKFSIGPYIRREKDKRHYLGLFKSYGITGLKKCQIIRWGGIQRVKSMSSGRQNKVYLL